MKITFWMMAFLISMTSCVGPFDEEDDGKFLALPVGTPFEVRLPADMTGFDWQIAEMDTTVVKLVYQPQYRSNDEPEAADGTTIYYFQTTGRGITAIKLEYVKEDDPGSVPAKFYELLIDCRI